MAGSRRLALWLLAAGDHDTDTKHQLVTLQEAAGFSDCFTDLSEAELRDMPSQQLNTQSLLFCLPAMRRFLAGSYCPCPEHNRTLLPAML